MKTTFESLWIVFSVIALLILLIILTYWKIKDYKWQQLVKKENLIKKEKQLIESINNVLEDHSLRIQLIIRCLVQQELNKIKYNEIGMREDELKKIGYSYDELKKAKDNGTEKILSLIPENFLIKYKIEYESFNTK